MHRIQPFTIRLVDRTRETSQLQPVRLKIDPGSQVTGMALVREVPPACKQFYISRSSSIAGRESAGPWPSGAPTGGGGRTRTSATEPRGSTTGGGPRAGWPLPAASGGHGADLGQALSRLWPIVALTVERVRFDMQQLVTPEITGLAYQQGTLAGHEVREYLLEKFRRPCACCDRTDRPLQVQHLAPKARGGCDRDQQSHADLPAL